jgi:hypothetical protein
MKASSIYVLAVCLPVFLASAALAAPELFVTYEGVSGGGNNQWLVAVAPDPAFFTDTTSGFGSALATELAFAIEGSTIANGSVVENDIDWPFDNPGNNPFTNSVTFGMWLNGANDKAFGAFGGNVFLSGAPVTLFSFQTLGTDPTTVYYGTAASGDPVKGAIIAQTGQNFPVEFSGSGGGLALANLDGGAGGGDGFHEFTGYTGSVSSVPEPSTAMLIFLAAVTGLVVSRRN